MWKVPLFNVNFGSDEKSAIAVVLESGWLTMGEVTSEFEREFAEFTGSRHAIAVCNGTAALHLAHKAIGFGEGDEVICPSLTFVAGANAILYCGAKPVFADIISDDNLTISPDDIESRIAANTCGIQVMHYGGYPCDMERIVDIARRHQLSIVEDCAHAPGSESNGVKCGNWGDVGCFSFFSNKNFTTGEGGMVVTNNDELAAKIRLMRSHGMTSMTLDRHNGHSFSYDVVEEGYNYRIDEMRAALGLVQLGKLSGYNHRRRRLVQSYVDHLGDIDEITIPFVNHNGRSACHILPILAKDRVARDGLMGHLKSRGIQSSIHYPPIHLFSKYKKDFPEGTCDLAVTEEVASRELTLPLSAVLSSEDVAYVCETVKEFSRARC